MGVLENQLSDARARYERAKRLDGMRRTVMQKTAGVLSEFTQLEKQGKLGNEGLTVIESLSSFQDTLSGFDSVRLINRPDYSETLAATDSALTKIEKIKAEINQVTKLANDLKQLNSKINRRGQHLIDGPTSSRIAEIAKSVSTLTAAKLPLPSETHPQLEKTGAGLRNLEDQIDDIMDREEIGLLRREMPSRSGVWRFRLTRTNSPMRSGYKLSLALRVLRLSTI